MHISELRIRNFRNFKKARFCFRKGVNTLIGENGSGKTNALYALRLLLDDSLARSASILRETDFCRALGNWKGHWIVIAIDFEELDPSEGCQLVKHAAGHMDGTDTGTYTLYFRPKLDVRKTLHGMATGEEEPEDIASYLETLTVDNYEALVTGRAEADILDDELYASLVGNFADAEFPDPDEEDQGEFGVRMGPIHPEISCTFAPALRDVVSDLRGYRSNPLLALLRGTESTIQLADAERIVKAITDLNVDISSLKEIRDISAGIQGTLHSTVGHTYSPSVGIESALPDRIDKLLQRLTVRVGDATSSEYRGDLSEQSLGGANLIYLALKLLEYELKLSSDRVAHFLLIEEPEAHIHTHIQKTLFEKQSAKRTQVIVSTHSTHVSSAAKIRSVNVLAQKREYAEVYQPARGLGDAAARRTERYLDAVRSTLLFAKGVVLVEGVAELVMIPSLLNAVFGMSPDEMGVSVISMDSAFFEHVAIVFHDDRIRRRCAIVTDHDQPFFELPASPDDDNDEEKHARAAAKSGANRYAALNDLSAKSSWISAFFADHTFEVDFLEASNAFEICKVVEDIYSQAAAKQKASKAIENDELAVSGREVLRLAGKLGKGWFALLLAEKLKVNTYIPSYILRAVAFAAAGSLDRDALKRMAVHRVADTNCSKDLKKALPDVEALQKMPAAEVITCFTAAAENDDLTEFIGYLDEYAAG